MIRRYSAKSKDELLLMIWIDRNQDFPVSFVEELVELMTAAGLDIISQIDRLTVYATLWRSEQ